MELKEVQFPTDFSPASEAAGRVARLMAGQSGARLHMLHVVAPSADRSLAAEGLVRVTENLGNELRVEMALLTGSAGQRIVDYAHEQRIDLIVMGARGRPAKRGAPLGQVARTVVALAPPRADGSTRGSRGVHRRR
jgi:nucleotide-binding universal stress UspA family protein